MTHSSVATAAMQPTLQGYLRSDGRKGIRNVVAVAYLVECAHHVAREIVTHFREPLDAFDDPSREREPPVHLIGFPGCYPNSYAEKMMEQLTTHPNVGAVLFVSLGCESMNKHYLVDAVRATGRPVDVLTIQEKGGTRSTIQYGVDWVQRARDELARQQKVPMALGELVIGTICGGSDGTSGITANPAVGRAFDRLIDAGATCIFEETGELVGCEFHMKTRAARPRPRRRNRRLRREGRTLLLDTRARQFRGRQCGRRPHDAGRKIARRICEKRCVADPRHREARRRAADGRPVSARRRAGWRAALRLSATSATTREIAELIACGSHVILFTTGRGSVVGSAISPVIKVCANPSTYRNLAGDMDVDAGRILEGRGTLEEVGREVFDVTVAVAQGDASKSETLGHQEFILTYKTFEPVGPACLPSNAALPHRVVDIAPH